jgi:hypothetical protein
MRFVSLNSLSVIAGRDPRQIAVDLLRLGIHADAELEQNKRVQPLFDYERVEAIAEALRAGRRMYS